MFLKGTIFLFSNPKYARKDFLFPIFAQLVMLMNSKTFQQLKKFLKKIKKINLIILQIQWTMLNGISLGQTIPLTE